MAETCPIPPVASSLESYILPRPTVSSIRQSLHSHLERQLRLENSQTLSLANLTDPPLTQTLPEPPASVTGVRRAYWRALRAHQVARERYEGLRAELDVVGGGRGEGEVGGEREGAGRELLPVVRAREARRKLGAVERALEAVERQGNGVLGMKIDEIVRKAVGEVPALPGQRGGMGGGGGGREDGEMRLVELKKAVLGAKATIQRCSSEEPGSRVPAKGDPELFALQRARNELIGWIEKQLALIGDAQADGEKTPSPEKNAVENGHVVSNEEIAQLYERYLAARRTLLDTVQTPQDISPFAPASDSTRPTGSLQDAETTASSATTVLPFIEPLLATKDEEQNLIHQAAYVRRQLTAAEAGSERLMRRFADESHLVHPGASRGRDWALAAEEASETTKEFVLARAAAGATASKEAEGTLRKVEGAPEGLERLAGQA